MLHLHLAGLRPFDIKLPPKFHLIKNVFSALKVVLEEKAQHIWTKPMKQRRGIYIYIHISSISISLVRIRTSDANAIAIRHETDITVKIQMHMLMRSKRTQFFLLEGRGQHHKLLT